MAYQIKHKPRHHAGFPPSPAIKSDATETTEWITPSGWTAEEAEKSFRKQHPGVEIISCKRVPLSSVLHG